MSDAAEFIHPATGEIHIQALMAAYGEKCDEAAALDFKLRQSARAEVALRKELAKQHANDPRSQQIRDVMEYWIKVCHKSARTKIPMDGVRAQKVRSRLNQDFTVEDLKLAIDGCARLPFVGPKGRVASQEPGCRREDDLELILRDEKYVERFMGYARVAEKAPANLADVGESKAGASGGLGGLPASSRPSDINRMPPFDRALHALRGLGLEVVVHENRPDSLSAQCPTHDDRNPSLSVRRDPDGKVWIKCWAGCSKEDILARLGLQWSDLWESSEHDFNCVEAPGRDRHVVPVHLRREMQTLLNLEKAT